MTIQLPSFGERDFAVFHIHGLDGRMEALRHQIRPKFEMIGQAMSTSLTPMLQQEVYTHVAKHARRTVHPPEETWVAWSTNKRGYKAHPHFQLGLRDTYLFAWFALIYECEQKPIFARKLKAQFPSTWSKIPSHFYISQDHTQPDVTQISDLSEEQTIQILDRLEKVKKAEFLCGIVLPRQEVTKLSGENLFQQIEQAFEQLLPLYHLAYEK